MFLERVASGDADATDECAICFEPAHATRIPCECRVTYCKACLEKALLGSIDANGVPRCPSCRSVFVLAAEPKTKELRLAALGPSGSGKGDLAAWRAEAALHRSAAQVELFKGYRDPAPERCLEERPLASTAPLEGLHSAGPDNFRPSCLCGSPFELVDKRIRVASMLDMMKPGWRETEGSEKLEAHALEKSSLHCDICGSAIVSGWSWACSRNRLVHPLGLDVCRGCYEQHCGMRQPDVPGKLRIFRCLQTGGPWGSLFACLRAL